MRLSNVLIIPGIFGGAAVLSLAAAWTSVGVIERVSAGAVERALILNGGDWAHVETDGLQVILTGTAPSETARFQALAIAGGEVDTNRVIDRIEVPVAENLRAPRFSVEILRNDSGISMIGLIPAATERAVLMEDVGRISGAGSIADFLESADYPVPDRWDAALDFAVFALSELPRSKISVDANRVEIEAIADSEEQKASWERQLRARVPSGVRLVANIAAPRPVITPFTARFVVDEDGARFDACAAGTEVGRNRIMMAGQRAGVSGEIDCTVGLGEPSPDWPTAVTLGVAAMQELGGGTITFSDADVSLVAASSVAQRDFDRIAGELEADLPEVFSLHATKIPTDSGEAEGPPEFTATKSAEGMVQLRGLLADQQERQITESVARARFGMDRVYSATRLDQSLPSQWSVRVLAGVEALSLLDNGVVVVQPDLVELRGETGDQSANAEISRILSDKLGAAEDFRVNVVYNEALDPIAQLPTPEECVAQINDIIAGAKITFAPGSVEIEASNAPTIQRIADVLRDCVDVPMEIGGHTDSQGGEEMNAALSQQRANSVLNALLAQRVLTTNLTAHGYGEEQPIADNDTEEGREENRRIEFRLVGNEVLPELGPDGEPIPAPVVVDPDLADKLPRARPENLALGTNDDGEAVTVEVSTEELEAAAAEADAAEAEDEAAVIEEDVAEGDEGSGDEMPMDASPEDDEASADTPQDDLSDEENGGEATDGEGDAEAEAVEADVAAEATDDLVDTETDEGVTDADATADAGSDADVDAEADEDTVTETEEDVASDEVVEDADATEEGAVADVTDADETETTETVDEAANNEQTEDDTTSEGAGGNDTADEDLGDPIVVDPELADIRPRQRPEE